MTTARVGVWRRTSPFAAIHYVGSILRALARNAIQLATAAGAAILFLRDRPAATALAFCAPLAILGAAILRYWFFRYRLEEDRVLVRRGVLRRDALDLPFDRVQGVNVERSPVDRLVGLVTVRLDTAGSSQAECELACVAPEVADWVGGRVRQVRRGEADVPDAAAEYGPDRAATDAAPALDDAPGSEGPALVRLGTADMLRIGIANRNLVLVATVIGILSQATDAALEPVFLAIDSASDVLAGLGEMARALVVAAVVVGGLAAMLALSTGAAWLRHHDFGLWQVGERFRTKSGLLTQRAVAVERSKIQQLRVLRNPIHRLLRRSRVIALSASSVAEGPSVAGPVVDSLEVPIATGAEAEFVGRRVFGAEGERLTLISASDRFARVSKHYVWALAIRMMAAPVAILGPAGIIYARGGPKDPTLAAQSGAADTVAGSLVGAALPLLVMLASATLALLWAWLRWRSLVFLVDGAGMVASRGIVGHRVDAFLFRKVQGVTIGHSPLQRRKGLATLTVRLASGGVTLPYLPRRTASELRDYILYVVESSRQRWH